MLKSKYCLAIFCIFFLGNVQANAAIEILRDDSGNIRRMNQYEASGVNPQTGKKETPDVCEAAGKGHLPTARELAKISQARGAKGILEPNQVKPSKLSTGFGRISAIDPNGQLDEFYFSDVGYQRPQQEYLTALFWSSSINSRSSDEVYALNGAYGNVYVEFRVRYNLAVLCVTGL